MSMGQCNQRGVVQCSSTKVISLIDRVLMNELGVTRASQRNAAAATVRRSVATSGGPKILRQLVCVNRMVRTLQRFHRRQTAKTAIAASIDAGTRDRRES